MMTRPAACTIAVNYYPVSRPRERRCPHHLWFGLCSSLPALPSATADLPVFCALVGFPHSSNCYTLLFYSYMLPLLHPNNSEISEFFRHLPQNARLQAEQ